jgi:hypothetical protein
MKKISTKLIAPCGMNCGICLGYLREDNHCPGCRGNWEQNRKYIRKCIIRNCELLKKNKQKFCSDECGKYPCRRLKALDKRYRTRYGMSMLENLENIKKFGIIKFIKNEEKRWRCAKCGGTICVHRGYCYSCGKKLKNLL